MQNQNNIVSNEKIEKILVCITPQSNSKRLIEQGAERAAECGGALHVLHVQKGDSIFNNYDSLKWLQQLFTYGSSKGGMMHATCDYNVAQCIARFVQEEEITQVVMGELPKNLKKQIAKGTRENQFQNIMDALPDTITLTIVPREQAVVQKEEKKRKII